ncbi:unnamed protein product [Lampetra planeri]
MERPAWAAPSTRSFAAVTATPGGRAGNPGEEREAATSERAVSRDGAPAVPSTAAPGCSRPAESDPACDRRVTGA